MAMKEDGKSARSETSPERVNFVKAKLMTKKEKHM
jgi:hypothetical protein